MGSRARGCSGWYEKERGSGRPERSRQGSGQDGSRGRGEEVTPLHFPDAASQVVQPGFATEHQSLGGETLGALQARSCPGSAPGSCSVSGWLREGAHARPASGSLRRAVVTCSLEDSLPSSSYPESWLQTGSEVSRSLLPAPPYTRVQRASLQGQLPDQRPPTPPVTPNLFTLLLPPPH